ncbi:hypothetical protein HKD37_07G017847 [Glycine soja]
MNKFLNDRSSEAKRDMYISLKKLKRKGFFLYVRGSSLQLSLTVKSPKRLFFKHNVPQQRHTTITKSKQVGNVTSTKLPPGGQFSH